MLNAEKHKKYSSHISDLKYLSHEIDLNCIFYISDLFLALNSIVNTVTLLVTIKQVITLYHIIGLQNKNKSKILLRAKVEISTVT